MPSNTPLMHSNISSAPTSTSLVPSNATPTNTSLAINHRSPTSSNPPVPSNSVHTSSASSSNITLVTTHSNTSLIGSAHDSSINIQSSAGPTTVEVTTSNTPLIASLQPSLDIQNTSFDASLHLMPTSISTIHPVSEPCSTLASEHIRSEVHSEQSHTVSANSTATLCQPSTEETARAGKISSYSVCMCVCACYVCVYILCTYSMSSL